MKITIDETDYEVNMEDETQSNIVGILNKGAQSLTLLDHITQCVKAIQKIKTKELTLMLKEFDNAKVTVT